MERQVLQSFTVTQGFWNKALVAGVVSEWLRFELYSIFERMAFGFSNEGYCRYGRELRRLDGLC